MVVFVVKNCGWTSFGKTQSLLRTKQIDALKIQFESFTGEKSANGALKRNLSIEKLRRSTLFNLMVLINQIKFRIKEPCEVQNLGFRFNSQV